jgi:hypothetical protein
MGIEKEIEKLKTASPKECAKLVKKIVKYKLNKKRTK